MDADRKPKRLGWEKQIPPPREGPRVSGHGGESASQEAATLAKGAVQVVLTIDTEADNAWGNHRDSNVTNVRELLRLHHVLAKYGAKATCLVTSRVVQDGEAIGVLRHLVDTGGAEIGAHLHPWESPPFMESGFDTRYPTFPPELPLDVFREKLRRLVEAIGGRFSPPTCYRGGRWGISPEHLAVLEQAGFEVDTTVTPLIDWRETKGVPTSLNGQGGVDFRSASVSPYHPDYSDVTREGGAKIIEVPLTVGFTRCVPPLVRHLYVALPELVHRVLRKSALVRAVWATPAQEDERHLLQMLAVVLREGMSVINMAIHSSELMVGGSPRSRSEEDVAKILGRLEAMLSVLASSGICRFTTLTDAARRWEALQHDGNAVSFQR
jgi:peptidoglycan/xylan/chitin deacetylase (PgdA/CDA1 family)